MAAAADFDLTTLEAGGVADVAYSPDETLLYAAMRNGNINVYDLTTRQKIATWHVGTQLGAISVSADGSFLLVTERQPAANLSTFYKVATASGAAVAVTTAGSAFRDVEIVDGDTAVLTGGGSGWPPTQTLYNLATGAFSSLPNSVYYSGWGTVLAEDEHLTLLAEPGISSGPLMLFDDRTNTVVARGDNYQTISSSNRTGFNFGSQAVSEAAGFVLQFIYHNTVLVYDLNLKYLRFFEVAGVVDGMVFDPTGAYVYIYEIESGYLSKYAVGTWTRVEQYFVGTSTWHNDIGYGSQLLINSDGTRITIVDTDNDIGKLRIVDLTGAGYFAGTIGADSFVGRKGDDTYIVNHVGDTIIEHQNEGNDKVESYVATYMLGENVENLTGRLATGQSLRGNGLANAITGAGGNDTLLLQDGGDDAASGGLGNDLFVFRAALNSQDKVDGGDGRDQIVIQGDYSGANALTLGTGVVNVESFALVPGNNTNRGDPGTNSYSYHVTTVNENVAAGQVMTLDGAQLRAGENFTFRGAAETDGAFRVIGGLGTDDFVGGSGSDVFLFNDGAFGSSDVVNGGAGTARDQLALRGDYAIAFGAGQLTSIESLAILSGFDIRQQTDYDYTIVMHDNNLIGGSMTVDAAQLRSSETFNFFGDSETDGTFRISSGAGDDQIIGGRLGDRIRGNGGNDNIYGHLGGDELYGGAGNDRFAYDSTAHSTSASRDRIMDFTTGDVIALNTIDADSGTAGDDAFTFIGSAAFTMGTAGQLRAYEDSAQAGHWFVEADVNGDGQSDLVIEVYTADLQPLDAADFSL